MELLTTGQVAKILGVTNLTVRRWSINGTGKLTPIIINTRGDRRFRKDDVEKLIGGRIEETK